MAVQLTQDQLLTLIRGVLKGEGGRSGGSGKPHGSGGNSRADGALHVGQGQAQEAKEVGGLAPGGGEQDEVRLHHRQRIEAKLPEELRRSGAHRSLGQGGEGGIHGDWGRGHKGGGLHLRPRTGH